VPGAIESIHIAARSGDAMQSVANAVLIAGAGIRGDRNYDDRAVHDQQITLIDAAAIERFNRETGLAIASGDPRRNVVTRDVDLNALVGKRFRVGQTTLTGVELCEPCATLGKRLARADVSPATVVAAFTHRAGLRARIDVGGEIRPGDRVGADAE
jgi:MOSC domain-containing protein YiiM